ncbi:MAG: hypothetical protein ACK2T3_01845 [Candidatus Promineifilaceae bacterium]
MVEAEDRFPELDVVLKHVGAMPVLALKITQQHTMAAVVREVHNAIKEGKIHYADQSIDVLHSDAAGQEIVPSGRPDISHEVIFVVKDSQHGDVELESQGILRLREEPPLGEAATLILEGGEQEERHEKILLLQRWAVAHEYGLGGQLRALHHRGPLDTLNRTEWVTEIQLSLDLGEKQRN